MSHCFACFCRLETTQRIYITRRMGRHAFSSREEEETGFSPGVSVISLLFIYERVKLGSEREECYGFTEMPKGF